jgi:hypothetical protein
VGQTGFRGRLPLRSRLRCSSSERVLESDQVEPCDFQ